MTDWRDRIAANPGVNPQDLDLATMTDRHTLNAILTTIRHWEDDPAYSDSEAMTDVARLMDAHDTPKGHGHPITRGID